MKLRFKAGSILLLCALVLSLVPAAMFPSQASAQTTCDRAQFVADVTIPDGMRFDPGATFTKTWQLRNIGTCTWTKSYSLVFDSGEKMGAPDSVAFTSDVPPGGTVDLTVVNMTAPGTAGRYRGYWKLKNASGGLFGIGVNANGTFWVEINVTGTSQANVVYDFTAEASKAAWSSLAGTLPSPGPDGDPRGFWITGSDFKYEDGSSPGSSILVGPQNITNGYIQAVYPAFKVQSGDIFKTQVGCELQATSCYVQFSLAYQIGSGPAITIWRFNEKWDRRTRPRDNVYPDIKLDALAGKDVIFILSMSAVGSPTGDRAIWGNPVIVRKGAPPPPTVTGTPPTATPTNTPGSVTVTVPPSSCDRAQFIADVTYPDGSIVAPGQTFTKTWSLKNVGTCPWTTSYQLVFFSGEQMGGPTSAPFVENVPVGSTAKFSINLTAPSTAGSHLGYWMFKNANGALFGWGRQGNQAWWVDIKVAGPSVTPGGPTFTPTPTVTPGGPTFTPTPTQSSSAGTAYDFAARACEGTWTSGAGTLQCPGTDGDPKGFVLISSTSKLESGVIDPRPGLLTFPQGVQDGYIKGSFPAFRVQSGDRFRSAISCEGGALSCYVTFRVEYQAGSDPVKILDPRRLAEKHEGQFNTIDVDLSWLAGKDVKFILTVFATGPATGDRALWVGPQIYRATGSVATSTATATSTNTTVAPSPSATSTSTNTTVAPSATPTGTATPSSTPSPTPTT